MPYDPQTLEDNSTELEKGADPTVEMHKAAKEANEKAVKGKGTSAATGTSEFEALPPKQFHPVIDKNEKVLVRNADAEKDWKNYRFTVNYEDGTHQELVFAAKDDGSATKTVEDRLATIEGQKGKYTLSLDSPKEIKAGEFGNEADDKAKKEGAKARADTQAKADAKADAKTK